MTARISEEDCRNICKETAEKKGMSFIDWSETFKGKKTKIIVSCAKHGEWSTSTVDTFSKSSLGCPCCAKEFNALRFQSEQSRDISCRNGKLRKKDDDIIINSFYMSGSFLKGTIFCRSETLDPKGYPKYWKYKCPVCSNDEYVKNGLCSGIFEAYAGHLKAGKRSCRCNNRYRWTSEQREYQIAKRIEKEKLPYTFSHWKDGKYSHDKSKFYYSCEQHGIQNIATTLFLDQKSGCPECSGFKPLQLYINLIYRGQNVIGVKYGIANDSWIRLKDHNDHNILKMKCIAIFEFESTEECKRAEFTCRRTFKPVLSSGQIKSGYTETTSVDMLLEVVKIAKNFNGKLIFEEVLNES